MKGIELSAKQEDILLQLSSWFKTGSTPYITLGGYAGTGKTTLIGYFRNEIKEQNSEMMAAFCSYTGKAARVLLQKLKEVGSFYAGDFSGTIHMLMYRAITDDRDQIIGWERKDKSDIVYNLLVVDEASMINGDVWRDLLDLGIPILAVGDHGQLPPIEGSFNLMGDPQLRLEEIFRQVEDSPIIKLATQARETGNIPLGRYSDDVRKLDSSDPLTWEFLEEKLRHFDDDTLVLTGFNVTRVKMNEHIRNLLGYAGEPKVGERVICLKNNHQRQVFNGMTGTVLAIEKVKERGGEYYKAEVLLDGEEGIYEGDLSVEQFGAKTTVTTERRHGIDLFDFGYALTVHKAQGSQAKKVILLSERSSHMDDSMWKRWLYTGITRASEELYIVG